MLTAHRTPDTKNFGKSITMLLSRSWLLALPISLLILPGTFLPSCCCVASEATAAPVNAQGDGNNDNDDDEYYNLEDMSNEELEEICTSRGFELVREDAVVYTHQDYVDAAMECLQIEEDL